MSKLELRAIDRHLGKFCASLASQHPEAVEVAAGLASAAVGAGDVCAQLEDCVALGLEGLADNDAWRSALLQSGAVDESHAQTRKPLVLDPEGRIYLARYFGLEQQIAQRLHQTMSQVVPVVSEQALHDTLEQLFPPVANEPDWQRVAVAVAARQRFAVISGGPGTGKTRTVARLLCLLQHTADEPLNIALAAPTGKAAARLSESIQSALHSLRSDFPEATAQVPTEASTLHRLLGYRPGGSFKHCAANPLAVDLLLVDEASMLDLVMMGHVLDALPSHARLIMLGDRDQLASVEAGNVLADICGERFDQASEGLLNYLEPLMPNLRAALQNAGDDTLGDGISLLRHSYRFDGDSAIGTFAAACNTGDWSAAHRLLQAGDSDVQWLDSATAWPAIEKQLVEHFRAVLSSASPVDAWQKLADFQLLCALRRGPYGVEELNARAQTALRQRGLAGEGEHYHGRPIMVSRNDPGQRLYNGDVGLILRDEQQQLKAYFDDGEGGVRQLLPARLPEHQSCYSMTIHKTQGSEFQRIGVYLPNQPNPLLTRQLLYTAVTRARQQVLLCGPLTVIEQMLLSSVQRRSGLRDALCQSPTDNPS